MTLPSLRAVQAWGLLMLVLGLLDGGVGLGIGVLVAAVLLARVRPQVIGWAGVAAWLAVPVAVVVHGLPSRSQVSPAFAFDDLIASHLAFAGLAFLVIATVLVRPAEAQPVADGAEGGPLGATPARLRWALISGVTLVAVAASLAVLQT